MPKFEEKQPRGIVQRKEANNILAIRWHDKRSVDMLSTLCKGKLVNSGKEDHKTHEAIKKPDMNLEYSTNMCLVDKADMMMANMETVRKSFTWYKKLFFHIMDMAILNSYNYYLLKNFAHPTMKEFTHDLVHQLL